MARIVNPHNIDVDDDAIFAGALSQGLIWIEDDNDDDNDVCEIEELEFSNNTTVRTLNAHTNSVNDVTVSGDVAISASSDKTLRVWNWKTGQHLRTLSGHTDSVNKVVISGDVAISASSDKTLRVWNWKTGQHLRTLSGHTHPVSVIALDGDLILAVAFSEIWIWNWKTGENLQRLTGWHRFSVMSVVIDGDIILSCSPDLLLVRSWKTGESLHKAELAMDDLENFAINGDFTITVYFDSIDVSNWKTGKRLQIEQYREINQMVFHTSYAICFYNLKVNKWFLYSLDSYYDYGVTFTDDYSHIINGDHNGKISVIRVDSSLQHLILSNMSRDNIPNNKVHNYNIDDVLEQARSFIRKRNENWINFSYVSQHLHETFSDLRPHKLGLPDKNYKSLLKLLADHQSEFELRKDSEKQGLYWIRVKPKQSSNKQYKRKSETKVVHDHNIDVVLQTTRDFIRKRNEKWVNFTRVSQHIHQIFPNLDLKALGQSDKNYKNLRNLLIDYPSGFELRQDSEKQGLYWIRLKSKN